jgi:hypothetical protein
MLASKNAQEDLFLGMEEKVVMYNKVYESAQSTNDQSSNDEILFCFSLGIMRK